MKSLLLIVAAAAVWSLAPPQAPTFRAGTDAVRVDVSVTRGGKPVLGLTADDFAITDEGVRQSITSVTVGKEPLDVLLLLDVSGSITGEALSTLQHAARQLIAALAPEDRVAIMTFSHLVRLDQGWTADRRVSDAAIEAIRGAQRTSLYDAVSAASLFGSGPGAARRHLVLVTDGWDTTSSLSPAIAIDQVKRSNLLLHVIRVGYGLSSSKFFDRSAAAALRRRRLFEIRPALAPAEFLPALTEATGGELIDAENDRTLEALCERVAETLRATYVLTYTPTGVGPNGWHAIHVSLVNARGSVVARRGYQR